MNHRKTSSLALTAAALAGAAFAASATPEVPTVKPGGGPFISEDPEIDRKFLEACQKAGQDPATVAAAIIRKAQADDWNTGKADFYNSLADLMPPKSAADEEPRRGHYARHWQSHRGSLYGQRRGMGFGGKRKPLRLR